jgi:hypothetical protein
MSSQEVDDAYDAYDRELQNMWEEYLIVLKMSSQEVDDAYDAYDRELQNIWREHLYECYLDRVKFVQEWWYSVFSFFQFMYGGFDADDKHRGHGEADEDKFRRLGWVGLLPSCVRGYCAKYSQYVHLNGDVTDKISPVGLPKSRPHKSAVKKAPKLPYDGVHVRRRPLCVKTPQVDQKRKKALATREKERQESRDGKLCM